MAAVRRQLLLYLCLLHQAAWTLVTGDDVHREVQEKKVVTLSCPSGSQPYIHRTWYRGMVDNTHLPKPGAQLYNQLRTGALNGAGARADATDFSIDRDNFQLTINGVRLQDDSNFTCRTYTSDNFMNIYDVVQISVYIQPILRMRGLETTIFRQNAKVKVQCEIDRLYPALPLDAFQMKWGDRNITVTKTDNRDGSFRYVGVYNKTLTKEDHGKVVSCSVHPVRGDEVSVVKKIDVRYISTDPPILLVNPAVPYLEDEVTFTCSRGAVTDNPPVYSVTWHKDGRRLVKWPHKSMSHTIKVVPSDSGAYTCMVANTIGFSAFSLPVHVNVSSSTNPFYNNVAGGVGGTLAVIVAIIIVVVLFLLWRKRRKQNAWKGKLRRPASKLAREKVGRLHISEPVSVEISGNTLASMEGIPSPTWVKSIADQSRPLQRAPRPKSMPCNPSLMVRTDLGTPTPGRSLMEALNLISPPDAPRIQALKEPNENLYENVKRHSAIH